MELFQLLIKEMDSCSSTASNTFLEKAFLSADPAALEIKNVIDLEVPRISYRFLPPALIAYAANLPVPI
jgi:hypothetical protein